MSKKYFFLFLLFLFSCNKDKKIESELKNSDSIFNYYKSLKSDKKITIEKKLLEYYKLLKIFKKTQNSKILRENISDLATEFYLIDDLNNFKSASKTLLNFSTETNDSILLAKSNRYLGRFFADKELNDSAFYYYIKAEKLYEKLGKKDDYATIQLNKGIIQYTVNDFLGADYSLTKALSILKNSDDKQKLYQIYLEISVVSVELKNYKKAIEFQLKAINLAKDYKFDDLLEIEIIGFNNLGYIYQSLEIHDKAIENFLLAYQTDKKSKVKSYSTSKILDNLGYSKLKSNDLTNLPNLFYESLKIRDSLGNLSLITGSYIHLSEYYDKTKDYKTSVGFANKALDISKKSKIPIDIVAALKQAAAVDKINASQYTSQYIRINDSLLSAERKNLDRFARIQLETDEVIKENKELGILNRNLVYYLLGTLVIFSLLIVIRTQKLRQKVIELKQEQQATNQEIYYLLTNQQETIENTQIQEKNRMAKELHDGILSQLFGLRLNLESIYEDTSNKANALRINYIEELKGVEKQIREISHDLNSEKAKISNNFVAIVIELLEKQHQTFSTKLKYDISKKILWKEVDTAAKINTYRILQESLQNTNKYAESKNIIVVFDTYGTGLLLTIKDDGKGFDVSKKNRGIGIANMKERALESFGSYEINSEKNKGSTTTLMIPYKNKQQI